MRTNRKFGILGQSLAVLTLTATLVGCGGSSDAGSPSGDGTASSVSSATPTVAGTPATTVAINNRYTFQPTLTNPQAIPVSFSIQNKPVWATFAPTTGTLSGVPSASDAGRYPSIVISANTGSSSTTGSTSTAASTTAALPAFAIQVTASTPPATTPASSSSSSGAATTPASSSSSSGATSPTTGSSSSSSSSGGKTSSSSGSTSSGGSSSSSSSGATSVSAQTSALLNYLTTLSGDSRHILTGQHTSYWDSNPMDVVQALNSQTGTYPAILGTTLSMTGSPENGVALANQWIAQGGIPLVSLWSDDPAGGTYNSAYSGSNFPDIYTPGTPVNAAWNAYLDNIAAQLKQINGPVMLRPFVELDGNWFWWGNQPTAQFVALWQYTWHRIMVTDGVTNALWIYNVNAYSGNYTAYYPGSAYVDIVSWDSYPPTSSDSTWYNALVGLGKPIILAETGVLSSDNSNVTPYAGDTNGLLQTVKANFPKVVAVVVWCQNAALSEQQGAESFMTDPAVLSLSDLPSTL
jgi:Glycosyl hydrolase family 26